MAETLSRRLASSSGDDELGGEVPSSGGSHAAWSNRRAPSCVRIAGLFLTWAALIQATLANGFSNSINWTPIRYLQFDTGDLISCKLAQKFQALGSFYTPGLEHWLLAYDARYLVDIEPNGALTETLIAVKHADELDHYQECYKHNNEKLPPNIVKGMVDAVRGKTLYYNLLRCNCKHYAHYWATGQKGGSLGRLSFLPPSRKCVYILEINTPPFYNRDTLIPAIPPHDQPQNIHQNHLLPQNTQQRPFPVPQGLQSTQFQVPQSVQNSFFVPQTSFPIPQISQQGPFQPSYSALSQQIPNYDPNFPTQFRDQMQFSVIPLQDQTQNNHQSFPMMPQLERSQRFQPFLSLLAPQDRREIQQHFPSLPNMQVMPWEIR